MTITRYAQIQKFENPNNLEVFESKKTKGTYTGKTKYVKLAFIYIFQILVKNSKNISEILNFMIYINNCILIVTHK
jgi:hypothetical protein